MSDAGQPPALAVALDLRPHPEGGWFRETWRSGTTVAAHGGERALATSILFLLAPGEHSRWHRVRSAELWMWQGGGPLRLAYGGDGGAAREEAVVVVGPDVAAGQTLQAVVPPGVWQAAAPAGDAAVVVGCVVAPGFDFADFELADDPTG